MKLAMDSYDRAARFMRTQARPLECALFEHDLEEGPVEPVLEALEGFRNPDGGFCKALEPDLRYEGSSVLCTTVALQVLHGLGAAADHPLAQGAVRYLMGVYDRKVQAWPITPPEVNSAPRAPWWHHGGQKGATEHDLGNPRPEVIGYLWEYPHDRASTGLRGTLTGAALKHLDGLGDDLEMHELLCYVRLADARGLSGSTRADLVRRLTPHVLRMAATEPERLSDYGLRPLDVAPTPQSPFADAMPERIEMNLEFDIAAQQADGSWLPNWTWSDRYPEVWPQARREWQGVLTLRRLQSLKAYGRVG